MSEICKELTEHAAHCKACGQFTTAEILLHARDWIKVCQSTITAQKIEITEYKKALAGLDVRPPGGTPPKRKAKEAV